MLIHRRGRVAFFWLMVAVVTTLYTNDSLQDSPKLIDGGVEI